MSSLFVVSDVHGYLDDFRSSLAGAGLVDEAGAWTGGDAQLWVLGDLLDRGPDGIGVVDFVMGLQKQAPDNVTMLMGTAIWIGLWSLLSKLFTRQTHAGWHLKVFLFSSLAWLVAGALPGMIAFSLSWPWVSDFGFVVGYAIGAAALYFHLLGVEPARPKLMRSVAVAAFVLGTGLTLWNQQQRSERLGSDLYLSSLQPPALRLARPVAADAFVDGLAALQPVLDRKAKEEPSAENGAPDED